MGENPEDYPSRFLLDPLFNVNRFDFELYDKLKESKQVKIVSYNDNIWLVSQERYTEAEMREMANRLCGVPKGNP